MFSIFSLLALLFSFSFATQNFSSSFKDNDFCEFDLRRIPLAPSQELSCGPSHFLPFVRMSHFDQRSFVDLYVDESVPLNKGIYRVELSVPGDNSARDNDHVSYKFSILFPSPAQPRALIFPHLPPESTAFVVAQWHARNGESPPIALRVLNSGELSITVDICPTPRGKTKRIVLWTSPLITDERLDFEFDVTWASLDNNGSLMVTLNGKKIVQYQGQVGQYEIDGVYYFKYGLYHSYPSTLPQGFNFSVLLGEFQQTVR